MIHPAETSLFQRGSLRVRAEVGRVSVAVRLADGVTTSGERYRLLVVHRHASKGLAHHLRCLQRVRLAIHTLGVYVDQTHLHGRERVFQRAGIVHIRVALIASGQPLLFGAPVDVLLWVPDVFAAEGKAEGLQAHRLVRNVSSKNHQVGPAELVAVLLFDWPQQAASLVEIDVVGPGVERGKTLIAGATATAAVCSAVGASRVPGHANHEAAVVAPVGRPPSLAVGHEFSEVSLQLFNVEGLDRVAVVEIGI